MEPGKTPGRRRWLAVAALSLGIQACVLYYLLHYGTLAGPLQWDDCAVALRGLQNLDRLFHSTSFTALLHTAYDLDIHAPLSDLQAMAGLLLSGGHAWGPYLLNAIWLAVALWAVRSASTHDEPACTPVVGIFFLLTQPLAYNALAHIKSDWSGGLLMAGALVLLTRGAQTRRRDLQCAGAIILGMSLLSKLTAFYLPVIAVATILLFEWYEAVLATRDQPGEGGTGKPATADAGPAFRRIDRHKAALHSLLAAGPFLVAFAWKLRPMLHYIRFATGSTWSTAGPRSPWERIRFYGPDGPGGWLEWGHLHVFFLLFAAAALFLAWRRKDPSHPLALFVHAAIGTLLLLPLALSPVTHSYASTLLGAVVSATLTSMAYVARSIPAGGCLAIGAGTLLLTLTTPLPLRNSNYYLGYPPVSNAGLRQLQHTYGQIIDSMRIHAHGTIPRIAVLYNHVFAPPPDVAIEYFRQTGDMPVLTQIDALPASALLEADFALTMVPAPGAPEAASTRYLFPTPISRNLPAADDLVRATGRFAAIGAFSIDGGEIHLYQRRP